MDWSRAKSVLIVSFFLLNILLGFQLWAGKMGIDTFSEAGERREEMNRLLASKQIAIEAEVPEATPKLNEITVRLKDGVPSPQKQPLDYPFELRLLSSAADIRGLLVKEVPEIGEYEPDPHAANGAKAVYIMNQLHNGLPMFEVRVELYAEKDTVKSYRKLYAEVQNAGTGSGEGQQVLSAYIVLSSLAENYLPVGAKIRDVRLGYHGPIFESETQVLAPYWRVALAGGDVYYVHAINGAVEGPISLGDTKDKK
ncbi:two-component system regulatory protein YycI [Paenibacillus alkalitolerans]|uniref:two-component system regulatory protein YycI n=1 Tax=Paenibacillus alkalitolerans TaxID=2799335 RepID=UPI0018F59F9D|nr:two-component system regulatory protein YycI [Paenibacillus alkalitolerans]